MNIVQDKSLSSNKMLEPNETEDNKTPAPKRRGRKRKSEILANSLEKIITVSTPVETVSRRGRPRKKVNYYELANPDNVEDILVKLKDENYYPTDEEVKYNRKEKTTNRSPTVTDNTVNNEVFVNSRHEVDSINRKIDGDDANFEIITNDMLEKENGIQHENLTQVNDLDSNQQKTVTAVDSITSNPKLRDKKYNYTGETVKMMNTLFNLFNQKGDEGENTSCNGQNESVIIRKGDGRGRGRRPYKKQKDKASDDSSGDGNGNVTCAVCNTEIDKNVWAHHKQRYHNNLAWRVGDTPLDLSDQNFVMYTLNLLYKKKKRIYCDKCGEGKKSVVGFLSHQSQCSKSREELESVKISCEICGRKMLPVSLITHMKSMHNEQDIDVVEAKSDHNSPLSGKRDAARKAMKIIANVTRNDLNEDKYFTSDLNLASQDFVKEFVQKELDKQEYFECKFRCNSSSNNLEDALSHMEECPHKSSEGFVCKQCLWVFTQLKEIMEHLESAHNIILEPEEANAVDKSVGNQPSFLSSTVRKTERVLFPSAFKWSYQFCEENLSNFLFENLLFVESSCPLLPPEAAKKYLPKMDDSCDTCRTYTVGFTNPLNSDYTFKRYKLFESEVHDNQMTLFCGGPVSSMSWLPTPYDKENEQQILAVSILNSPDGKYQTNENFDEASAIQFWNFGCLKNKENSLKEPELMFNLAHDHGPLWHMEWCPSGCHNFVEGSCSRMGLLAVTGSDSFVYIYSIPFVGRETGLYYKPRPVMRLLLQRPGNCLLGGSKYYPTKISWSKASGHSYLAVGYTNGFVAMFNLNSSSVLLKYTDADGIISVLPYKYFQAHSHSITALALYHLNGGCRWLMTGAFDRSINLWDLRNTSYPICNTRKNIITDGFWFTNWLCYVTGSDEASTSINVTGMLKQARDYMADTSVSLTCSLSTISTLSGSDWLNGMLHANTVGEIVGLFPHQIFHIPEKYKVFKAKRMLLGFTYLVEKEKWPSERLETDKIKKNTLQNLLTKKLSAGVMLSKIKSDFDHNALFSKEPIVYHEADKKYAVLFCDSKMASFDDFPTTSTNQLSAFSKLYGVTHPNQYPMTAINKIVFNPNRQASLYFATAYQVGFVRISWMGFLKGDRQIN